MRKDKKSFLAYRRAPLPAAAAARYNFLGGKPLRRALRSDEKIFSRE
jgi:hypothetical protein